GVAQCCVPGAAQHEARAERVERLAKACLRALNGALQTRDRPRLCGPGSAVHHSAQRLRRLPIHVCTALRDCRHACQIFSAVAGMSGCAPAPPGMASATAFMSAAIAAVVPASPAPFTPSGLVFAGTA